MTLPGSGTASDPYIISTASQLQELSGDGLSTYGPSSYYELGADIDMSSVSDFTPIGTYSYSFTGHFDGNNHTISNMNNVQTSGASALISCCDSCEIKNLIINNSYFSSNSRVSCICGVVNSNCRITNIKITNCICITSNDGVGAIAGYSDSTGNSYEDIEVSNSYIGSTRGSYYTRCGGIVGKTSGGDTFSNCSVSKCTIMGVGGSYVGGIYGITSSSASSYSTVSDCTVSDCSIIGTSNVAGVGN